MENEGVRFEDGDLINMEWPIAAVPRVFRELVTPLL